MATITLEISDELADELGQLQDRLPELLALSLRQPALPAATYHYILDFLASNPTPAQIAAFGPTPEMRERLATLLERNEAALLTASEQAELDDYERIEHLMILIKAGNLAHLTAAA